MAFSASRASARVTGTVAATSPFAPFLQPARFFSVMRQGGAGVPRQRAGAEIPEPAPEDLTSGRASGFVVIVLSTFQDMPKEVGEVVQRNKKQIKAEGVAAAAERTAAVAADGAKASS